MTRFIKSAKSLSTGVVRAGTGTLFYSGALNLLRSRKSRARETGVFPFAVLLYHRVNPDNDPFFPANSVGAFAAQMRYLKKNFRVLTLSQIVDNVEQGRPVEPWTIAITFDDGYRDNYLYAHPILKEYDLPATLFAATGYIGGNLLMWNDRLAWAIKNTEQNKIACQFDGREIILALQTEDDKLRALNFLLAELKPYREDDKNLTLEHLIEALRGKNNEPARLMLDWQELGTMAKEGWDVGSHTVNHVILTKIELPRAAEELKFSKDVIEEKLQRPAKLCAFPNGKKSDFSAPVKMMVKELGYHGAVTTIEGMNASGLDLFELRRRSVWEEHLPTLACKLNYLYCRRETSCERN